MAGWLEGILSHDQALALIGFMDGWMLHSHFPYAKLSSILGASGALCFAAYSSWRDGLRAFLNISAVHKSRMDCGPMADPSDDSVLLCRAKTRFLMGKQMSR